MVPLPRMRRARWVLLSVALTEGLLRVLFVLVMLMS